MAMDAKMSLLSQVEHRCKERLTAADLDRLMGILSDVMQSFRVDEIRREDTGQEDDLLRSYVASMKVQGRSPKTIERYVYVIGRFMRYAKANTRDINVYHVRNWLTAGLLQLSTVWNTGMR